MFSLSPRMIRKIIHFGTGLFILLLSYLVNREWLLWLIAAGSLFAFATFPYRKFYLLHKSSASSLGTLFYPAGILTAYLLLYNLPLFYFRAALMVLILSDTTANFTGHITRGNGWFRILEDKKSMHGIAGFIVSTLLVFFIFLPLAWLINPAFLFLLLLVALILEIVSWRGSDNFSIPTGLAVFFLFTHYYTFDYTYTIIVIAIMSAGCYLLFRSGILTRYGSFTAWLLGIYLTLMGPEWLVVVLAFFISSVILTKIRAGVRGKKKKSIARNAWQVIANILWAALSSIGYLFTLDETFIHLFIAFVAAVTADTWASEAGPLFSKRCWSIADGRMHAAGTTGGVSIAGTMAALAGAFFITLLGLELLQISYSIHLVIIITLSAFLACFADTLLGAFAEHRLIPLLDHPHPEHITANDVVNLGGSAMAGVFYYLLV
jgi:uncharacterized protein (TIGR00297 family)